MFGTFWVISHALSINRLALDRWNVSGVADFAKEMEEKELGKPKVSLQFQLTDSGLTTLLKAEATVEETYTVEEEVEVDDEEGEAGNETNATETETKEETKEEETAADESEANATEANETATDANATDKTAEKPKKKKKTIMQTKVSFV